MRSLRFLFFVPALFVAHSVWAQEMPTAKAAATPAADTAAPAIKAAAEPPSAALTDTPAASSIVVPEAAPVPENNVPVTAELSDGTQAIFSPDGSVTIVKADGSKNPPPDGVLTLKDGTTFAVQNGMRTNN